MKIRKIDKIIFLIILVGLLYFQAMKQELLGYVRGSNNNNLYNSAVQIVLLNARINDTPELLKYKIIRKEINSVLENYEQSKNSYLKSNNLLISHMLSSGFEEYPAKKLEKAKKELEEKLKIVAID